MHKSLQAGETYMYKGRPPAIRPPESTPEHRHLILRHSPCTSMSMRDVYLPFYCPVFRDAYMLVLFVTGKPYQATGFLRSYIIHEWKGSIDRKTILSMLAFITRILALTAHGSTLSVPMVHWAKLE